MMIPLPVPLIPHFQIVLWLKWVNTYQALIAPFALSAFGIFLMRGFMQAFPDELLEAARLDGASSMRTFFMIVLPTMAPACAALGIITFLHQWESLLWPIVVANASEMQTLSVGLASFTSQTAENSSLMNPFAGRVHRRRAAHRRVPDLPTQDRAGHRDHRAQVNDAAQHPSRLHRPAAH